VPAAFPIAGELRSDRSSLLQARTARSSSPGRVTGAGSAAWDDLHRTRLALDPFVESFNGRSQDELLNVEEWVVGHS